MLDEHNGILLDLYYSRGVLVSEFEVESSRIVTREELDHGTLWVEMNTFSAKPTREGGVPRFRFCARKSAA